MSGEIEMLRQVRQLRREVDRLKALDSVSGRMHQHIGLVSGVYELLPELRGFWPFSSADETGAIYDLSGQGRTLTKNGGPSIQFLDTGMPYVLLDGSGDYYNRADEAGLDVTGELTFGGWDYITADTTASMFLFAKGTLLEGYSFWLYRAALNTYYPVLELSDASSPATRINVDYVYAVPFQTWFFWAGRYTPSVEAAIFYNGVKVMTDTTGIPAALVNSARALETGIDQYGGNALRFICAKALSNGIIENIFETTRWLFGV